MTAGEILKNEREKQGISVEQISSLTKVSVKVLQALENDKYEELPAKPFVLGFIKSYSKVLSIPVHDVIFAFEEEMKKNAHLNIKKRVMGNFEIEREDKIKKNRTRMFGIAASLLMLGVLVIAGLKTHHGKTKLKKGVDAKTAMISENHSQTSVADSASVSTNALAASNILKAEEIHQEVQASDAPKMLNDEDSEVIADTKNDSNKKYKYRLIVRAREDSWVKIQADNASVRSLTLKKSKTMLIKADEAIKLLTGNIGDLEFALNGQNLPSQGRKGEVKSLVFPFEKNEDYKTSNFFKIEKAESKSKEKLERKKTTSVENINEGDIRSSERSEEQMRKSPH